MRVQQQWEAVRFGVAVDGRREAAVPEPGRLQQLVAAPLADRAQLWRAAGQGSVWACHGRWEAMQEGLVWTIAW